MMRMKLRSTYSSQVCILTQPIWTLEVFSKAWNYLDFGVWNLMFCFSVSISMITCDPLPSFTLYSLIQLFCLNSSKLLTNMTFWNLMSLVQYFLWLCLNDEHPVVNAQYSQVQTVGWPFYWKVSLIVIIRYKSTLQDVLPFIIW